VAVPKSTFRNPSSSMIGGQIIWGRVIVFGAIGIVLFILGMLIAGNSSDSVTREAYNEMVSQRDKAEQELAQIKADQQLTRSTQPADQTSDTTPVDPTTGTQSYTVVEGDTWSSIAKKFYGDASLYTIILDENNKTKNTPLKEGMVLEIPPKPESAKSNSSSSETTTTKAKSKSTTTTTTTKPKSKSSTN